MDVSQIVQELAKTLPLDETQLSPQHRREPFISLGPPGQGMSDFVREIKARAHMTVAKPATIPEHRGLDAHVLLIPCQLPTPGSGSKLSTTASGEEELLAIDAAEFRPSEVDLLGQPAGFAEQMLPDENGFRCLDVDPAGNSNTRND